jgi:hypothetical protein
MHDKGLSDPVEARHQPFAKDLFPSLPEPA